MVRLLGPDNRELELRGDTAAEAATAAVTTTLREVASNLHGHVTLDDLGILPTIWKQHVPDLLGHVTQGYDDAARMIRRQLGLTAAVPPDQADQTNEGDVPVVTNRLAELEMANAQNRLVRVSDEIWQAAREQLLQGLQVGEGVASLRDRVRASVQFSQARAQLVARSEVSRAMNQGALTQVQAEVSTVGIPLAQATKEWIATKDGRTRPEHALMDGQKVPLDGTFSIGFDPGDDYNCRCCMGYDLPN